MVCKIKFKKYTIHVTPEMAQELLRLKLIECVPEKQGYFRTTRPWPEEWAVWKVLRSV